MDCKDVKSIDLAKAIIDAKKDMPPIPVIRIIKSEMIPDNNVVIFCAPNVFGQVKECFE
jgi:hypothetical protein